MLLYEIENVAFCHVYKSREQFMVDSTIENISAKRKKYALIMEKIG